MTKLSARELELDGIAQRLFFELSEDLNPVEATEVVSMLAACIIFAGRIGEEDGDAGIDLIAKMARAKHRIILAYFKEKEEKEKEKNVVQFGKEKLPDVRDADDD